MNPFVHRASLILASTAHDQHDFRMGSEKEQPKGDEKDHSFEKPELGK